MKENSFFIKILNKHFRKDAEKVYAESPLLRYLEIKTHSVDKSSKSRANLGSLYAIYVLVEDYFKKGFKDKDYSSYDGAKFSDLLNRQRQLKFGEKLQNHAFNHRCNEEFKKFFPKENEVPIIRDQKTKRYWINERLIITTLGSKKYNLSKSVIEIINKYISLKIGKFNDFLNECTSLKNDFDKERFLDFLKAQLMPSVDARIFEIVSFVILKNYYLLKKINLYKTGRTNANDGGIDFVMRPPGRFFQVTEVLDFKKYFLDIDKVNRFPITFVIKFDESQDELKKKIKNKAKSHYDEKTLKKYMKAIEEIIPIPKLIEYLGIIIKKNKSNNLLNDLIVHYKVEFNIH